MGFLPACRKSPICFEFGLFIFCHMRREISRRQKIQQLTSASSESRLAEDVIFRWRSGWVGVNVCLGPCLCSRACRRRCKSAHVRLRGRCNACCARDRWAGDRVLAPLTCSASSRVHIAGMARDGAEQCCGCHRPCVGRRKCFCWCTACFSVP